MAATSDLEAQHERYLERDRSLARLFNYATLAASIFIVVVLLVLTIPMGRTSPLLIGLSLYAFATRMCVFAARYALGTPAFLLDLDSADTARADAARRVFERNRETVARDLLTFANERPSAEKIAALTPREAAAIARERDPATRRRAGLVCLAAWVIVSVAIWGAVLVTGGGPTN